MCIKIHTLKSLLLLYSKKIKESPSSEILHTCSMPLADNIPNIKVAKSPPMLTKNYIMSIHITVFRSSYVDQKRKKKWLKLFIFYATNYKRNFLINQIAFIKIYSLSRFKIRYLSLSY